MLHFSGEEICTQAVNHIGASLGNQQSITTQSEEHDGEYLVCSFCFIHDRLSLREEMIQPSLCLILCGTGQQLTDIFIDSTDRNHKI